MGAKLFNEGQTMRVIKKDGQFQIDDRPMSLSGKAASQVMTDLETGRSRNPKHDQVLAEIREIVEKRKAK